MITTDQSYATQNPAALSAPVAHEEKRDIVRRVFDAYKFADRAQLEPLLASSFRFTSPQDDAIDREEYFRKCWPTHEMQADNTIEHIFVEGDHAYVTYLIITKDGRQFRNTELMAFADGQITEVIVFFGPTYKNGRMVMGEGAISS